MATYITDPTLPELPDELLLAIGRLATEWARFEFRLDVTIWLLMATPDAQAAACVTAQNTISARKLDSIIALAKYRGCPDAILKQIRKIQGKTRELQRRRNRIVHDMWLSTVDGTHYRLEITAEKTLVFEHKPVPLKEIEDCCIAIRNNLNNYIKISEAMLNDQAITLSLSETLRGRFAPQVRETPHG